MQLPGSQLQQPGPQQCSCRDLSNSSQGLRKQPGPQQCSCQDLREQPGPQQCSCQDLKDSSQDLSNAAARTLATAARASAMQLPGSQPCSCQDLSNAAAGISKTAARSSAMQLPGPWLQSCQDLREQPGSRPHSSQDLKDSSQGLGHAAARTSAMQLPGAQARSTNQGSGWGSHPSHEGLGPPSAPIPGAAALSEPLGGGGSILQMGVWDPPQPPPRPPCVGPQLHSLSGNILAWKPFPKTRFSRLLKA